MRLACVERDDHALMLEIDSYILHPGNLLERRSQLAHTLIAIFARGGYLDRFQDRMIGPFEIKRIGWIRIVWSSWVHGFLYLTCETAGAVVSRSGSS